MGLEFSFKKLMTVGGTAVIASITIVSGMMFLGYAAGNALGFSHIIGDSIMELVTPSSGEKTYYRMLNNRQVMLSDKEGTISQSLLAEHYILNKK